MSTPEDSIGGFPFGDFPVQPGPATPDDSMNYGDCGVSGEASAYLDRHERVSAALSAATGATDPDEAVMIYRLQNVRTPAEQDAVVQLYTLQPELLRLSYQEIMSFPLD